MTNFVSIITPTYNHEKYIATCINSVLSQIYQDWEIIIIDDDSTDKTPDIIKRFTDKRIKYIHQEHSGIYNIGKTYNKALTMARGDIIAILEGDDYWPPQKLKLQVPTFDNPMVVLTYGDACEIDSQSKITCRHYAYITDAQTRQNQPIGSIIKYFMTPCSFIYSPTVCLRKDALVKIGGFVQPDYIPSVDFTTWCRMALEGEFGYIPEVLGYWRRHIKNISLQEDFNLIQGAIKYSQDFIKNYRYQIESLHIDINTEKLKSDLSELSTLAINRKDYNMALHHLEIGENRVARRYFLLYLRARHKLLHLKILALAGILSSYLGLKIPRLLGEILRSVKRYTT